jgi:hypothetical protein
MWCHIRRHQDKKTERARQRGAVIHDEGLSKEAGLWTTKKENVMDSSGYANISRRGWGRRVGIAARDA